MPEVAGSLRPGGRTARTREAVLNAVRETLADPAAELTVPGIAQRAGVHATTVYRRWQTIESLVLDVVVSDVRRSSPIPATGDLRADLTTYVDQLLTSLRGPHALGLLRALLAASRSSPDPRTLAELVQPRVADFQAMLDAAGVTAIDGMGCIEIVIAPAYLWAQLGSPLDPAKDTERLVDTVLRVSST
ncbi:TetR/AcrR family transcriptional regulator C-terminal ligand-binding domain-containing protein [Microbacterium sp. M1A1_1b]|uniref:TetR/AcrR family transcriptional regulator C-terminal ligand-binding domain-containing protein n=1 Tax=Curtobacterium sp. VKM Ac-2922 TaxID=2929475 RepID=UPI001FB3AE10|nr:TetR/AcrR family transcriptional regulator C-terminal ligand-binding domain-containing protein [Curtobacterium sp. VKM Ac-2922]MCJ1714024.1 TetR/AcrR family transcriptional regulator C-terminal ligand-binding domain-containing protein [Curtobacterium sp. VKM Ac-2922]